jgi:hypothetical protein
MNDLLADRYFNIIQKQIRDEQTYMETIQREYDKYGSSGHVAR